MTTQNRLRQAAAALVALTVVLSVFGPLGTAAAQQVQVSQSPTSTTAAPGDTVTLQTTIEATDVNGQGLQIQLPDGWMGNITDADGGSAKPPTGSANTLEVVWLESGTYTVTYEVYVPANATAGDYTVDVEGSGVDPSGGDRIVDSTQTTITVETAPQNAAPTADAGDDQTVDEGATVQLDATGSSDSDGSIESYSWNQTGGPSVSLSDDSAAQPTFTAPAVSSDTTLTFQLEVTDDDGATSTDTVTVTVQNVPEPDPANFQVSNLDVESPVTQGDASTVTATVENTGDESGTQTVTLAVDGSQVDSQSVPLAGGASEQVTFEVDTTGLSADDHDVTVATDDDSEIGTLAVQPTASDPDPEPAPADFQVSNLQAPGSATQGDLVDVSATVTNDGDQQATQTVELRVDTDGSLEDGEVLATKDVTLDGGESETVSFEEVDTSGLAPGDYVHGVVTDDDSVTATITVTDGGEQPEPNVEYWQIDFVVGEPLEQVGPEGGDFYHDQDRMIRFLHGQGENTVTAVSSSDANLPAETQACIDSEAIEVHDNGTASVQFTVAEGCELTLTLAVHEKPGPGFDRSMTQPLVVAETETFGPGTHTLLVELPE